MKIKQFIAVISALLTIQSCSDQKKENQAKISDTLMTITEQESPKEAVLIQDSVVGIVYVKNKIGTIIKEFPISGSNDKDSLEFGTKLFVIFSNEDNSKNERPDTNWIEVKTEKCKLGTIRKYKGYVHIQDIVDSSAADFSVIPIDYKFDDILSRPAIENEGKLKFRFSKISLKEFNDYRLTYNNQTIVDSSKINQDKEYFTLIIANRITKFYSNICKDRQHYKGYVKPLDSYEIETCSREACSTYLINKSTGKSLSINSGYYFVQGTSLPFISKDEKKLIIFTSEMSKEDGYKTYMILYKKNPAANSFNFTEYDSYSSNDWNIKELIWVDSQTIAIKVEDSKEIGYLKGTIQ